MKLNLKILKWDLSLNIRESLRPVDCLGSYSLCQDGRHIIYLDYDNAHLDMVYHDLQSLQKNFWLSTFYIFRSSDNSYHAICLDKIRIRKYEEILKWSNCDANFKRGYKYNQFHSFVLRQSVKSGIDIVYVACVINQNHLRTKSKAHAVMLNKLFNTKIKIDKDFDDYNKVNMCIYKTYQKG